MGARDVGKVVSSRHVHVIGVVGDVYGMCRWYSMFIKVGFKCINGEEGMCGVGRI